MIYLTSDSHFGHTNIIKYCKRPFDTADEMDQAIIDNINATCRPQDDLWHLGDFTFRSKHSIGHYLEQIKCRVHIVLGSHDKDASQSKQLFSSVHYGIKQLKVNKEKIVLCHWPLLSWDARCHGRLHFFGHVHTAEDKRFPCQPGSCDVGVDYWNFSPVSLEEASLQARSSSGKLKVFDKFDNATDS